MVRSFVALFVASQSALAMCQSGEISLGDAMPIDHHVVDVEWQPEGHVLVYQRQEDKSFGLGVYEPGKFEGKVVLPLEKSDTYETNWLADSNSALVVVRGVGAKPKSIAARIYLIEGDTQSAKLLFSDVYDEKSVPSIEVNTSPGLKHAIVTFRSQQGVFHKVLTLGGGNITDAPDLDRAEKEGLSGPSWSLDGTAIYAPKQSLSQTKLKAEQAMAYELQERRAQQDSDNQKIAAANQGVSDVRFTTLVSDEEATKMKLMTERYTVLKLRRYTPSPNVGSDVLELMPANPILRPIRFRGPWVYADKATSKVRPKTQSIVLKFDQSNAQDNCVWLTRGNEKGAPAAVVAVHVTDTWLASTKNGVAYTIDGALFYRAVK